MKACGTCKFRENGMYDMPCLDCEFDEGGNPTRYEPQTITNGDRIRAMTDEELAIKLAGNECPPNDRIPYIDCCKITCHQCYNCWLDWLRQEKAQ